MVHTPDLAADVAGQLWEQIAQFASYSFCRAHACVYGRIAWQTAWLKAHHPVEFYVAVFSNHMGMYPMRVHVSDAIRHGVRVFAAAREPVAVRLDDRGERGSGGRGSEVGEVPSAKCRVPNGRGREGARARGARRI